MKLIYAIINKHDSDDVQNALTSNGFSVTKLATTGGFLKTGNTTFIIGTESKKVAQALDIINKNSKKRTEKMLTSSGVPFGYNVTQPLDVTVGGATVFVTNVERFEKY